MVKPFLLPLFQEDPVEARNLVLRELDLHGGSPGKVARSLGVPLSSLQGFMTRACLQGAARQARERWSRMFRLGGNDAG